MNAESVLFWVFSAALISGALGVLFFKNPIASAMSLVATFFFLAGIYVLLWAHTIAVLQVLVYAGAVMVLFLFVIMLLNLTHVEAPNLASPARWVGLGGVAALLGALLLAFSRLPNQPLPWTREASRLAEFGTLAKLGDILYRQWLFPFEAVSLLLLVAILGAVVVAKPRI